MNLTDKLAPTVPKRALFFMAALVWGFAGSRILKIGFTDIFNNTGSQWLYIMIGIAGFYFFFKYVFYKMYLKHTKRIVNSVKEKLCIFSFFDVRGFTIMAFMIAFGVTMRKLKVVPPLYMGTFYITLGLSLSAAALSFLYSGIRYDLAKEMFLIKVGDDEVSDVSRDMDINSTDENNEAASNEEDVEIEPDDTNVVNEMN